MPELNGIAEEEAWPGWQEAAAPEAGPAAAESHAGRRSAEEPDGSRLIAELVFPALADWQPVLDRLELPTETRIGLAARAEADCWPLSTEAVASGIAEETEFHRAFAAELGFGFEETVDPARLILTEEVCVTLLGARRRGLLVKREGWDGQTSFLVAAMRSGFAELHRSTGSRPDLRARLKLVAPTALRRALFARASGFLSRIAASSLFEHLPHMSARITLNAWQGGVVGAAAIVLPLAFVLSPELALLGIHILASAFFVGCVALRGAAIRSAGGLAKRPLPENEGDAGLPVYSVLVALYREKEVVPQLLEALEKLDWPPGRLDVKLVCEADDRETIAAIQAERPPPFVEVVEVPPGTPRTKPKALNYALPSVGGDFVVLFDAEDRPDPLQLREAFARFAETGPELACLQAPLVIANGEASYVSRLFAFEYAALFRGLLPYLSRKNLPLPLGGTSNHFRLAALRDVGAWDPFNVTEDADLALRLARFGYRTEVIGRATLEDAPERFGVWLPQRTRWFKGYMQTWLVHMRDPAALLRELGSFRSFLAAQILFAGLIVSALVHPLLLTTFFYLLLAVLGGARLSALEGVLMALDAANIAFGYAFFLVLGWRTLTETERRSYGKVVLGTPVYWMMLSLAAWRALWQLWRRPHHWSKTPHKRAAPAGT